MQGTPAVLYAGHVQISVRTVLRGMVLSKLLFCWSKSFFIFTFFTGPLVLRTGTVPARPPGCLTATVGPQLLAPRHNPPNTPTSQHSAATT